MTERYSIQVLKDCIDLQTKKGADYQSTKSTVRQVDYYRLGVSTIYDIMWAKMLRLKSQIEASENDPNHTANFESISDSGRDLINYVSFMVSYAEGKMDGQDPNKDFLNRPIVAKDVAELAADYISDPETYRKEYASIIKTPEDIALNLVTKSADLMSSENESEIVATALEKESQRTSAAELAFLESYGAKIASRETFKDHSDRYKK